MRSMKPGNEVSHRRQGQGCIVTEANQRQVAIIDDDDAVRNSLRFLLEVVGYSVAGFASAAEFLEAEPTGFACLILDHHMPNMTGLQLADRLRADGVSIPILLITGSPSPDMVVRAAELGIDRVLEKPPDEEELLGFIRGVWSQQREPSPFNGA